MVEGRGGYKSELLNDEIKARFNVPMYAPFIVRWRYLPPWELTYLLGNWGCSIPQFDSAIMWLVGILKGGGGKGPHEGHTKVWKFHWSKVSLELTPNSREQRIPTLRGCNQRNNNTKLQLSNIIPAWCIACLLFTVILLIDAVRFTVILFRN